jgi:transposase
MDLIKEYHAISPDLNPIENLWNKLKLNVWKSNLKNLLELAKNFFKESENLETS